MIPLETLTATRRTDLVMELKVRIVGSFMLVKNIYIPVFHATSSGPLSSPLHSPLHGIMPVYHKSTVCHKSLNLITLFAFPPFPNIFTPNEKL